jgi:hypothetical protein
LTPATAAFEGFEGAKAVNRKARNLFYAFAKKHYPKRPLLFVKEETDELSRDTENGAAMNSE